MRAEGRGVQETHGSCVPVRKVPVRSRLLCHHGEELPHRETPESGLILQGGDTEAPWGLTHTHLRFCPASSLCLELSLGKEQRAVE